MSFSQSLTGAIIFLIIGFIILIKGADIFIEGSANITKAFSISPVIIGMTVVAIGTSLPETAVSIVASVTGNNELAISNAVGSNIFNLMIVIGVCAIIAPVSVQPQTLKKDFPFSIMCAALLLILGFIGMRLERTDGVILFALFMAFFVFLIRSARNPQAKHDIKNKADENEPIQLPKSILWIVIGATAIALGSNFVIKSATTIAISFGISQTIIGLTILAFGTGLPELMTSIVAAKKNEIEMALGNAIGSNICNILIVLGIASTISPIDFLKENIIDIFILILFSFMVWIMAYKNRNLNKRHGFIMCSIYITYVVYILLR